MRVAIFSHSLLSDWNHGNAHFLRGVATELTTRGHEVLALEQRDAWSVVNLLRERGPGVLGELHSAYPSLRVMRYDAETLDLDAMLDRVDLVLVHEWNRPELVAAIGAHRIRTGGYTLLFHDTHHRAITRPDEMSRYDLSAYDGALVFGEVLREIYLRRQWAARAWTWHEAADVRVFHPAAAAPPEGDLVWIGNWGDDERTAELGGFLIGPARDLGLRARVHGVRYPAAAREQLARAGIEYAGWLPNFRTPQVYARFRMTIHIPRAPYVQALPGIPTIRVFEALACGIPLVVALWRDIEGLFMAGRDFLRAATGGEMREQLRALMHDDELRRTLVASGLATVHSRHTCAHRVDELLAIHRSLRTPAMGRAEVLSG